MNSSFTISADSPPSMALDYNELRKEGIAYLENVVSSLWTDYNVHDPGITLLELLCFGITDVAYRTSFDDADLFAQEVVLDGEGKPKKQASPFITAREALSCAPVTANDYRRLILDECYENVRNVWVEKTTQTLYGDPKKHQLTNKNASGHIPFKVKGLYNIRLQLIPKKRTKKQEQKIIDDVRDLYHKNRLLGEDLNSITISKDHPIMVCADVRLAPTADIEKTYAAIVHQLRNFLSPRIPRYKLADLVAKGLKAEEIFEGPRLVNGFILEEDLKTSTSVATVRSSDLIAEILKVDGVVALPKILLNHAGEDEDESELWELQIPPDFEPELSLDNARLRFYKDLIPFQPDLDQTREELKELLAEEIASSHFPGMEDFPIPGGQWMDLSPFTTLQESLPAVYGCGSRGTNRDPSPQALGKARQLKAYLLIFDQILANYLGQLVNLTSLFSNEPGQLQTLFSNAVSDIPDLQYLLKSSADTSNPDKAQAASAYINLLNANSVSTDFQESQRSQILDHLLARFGEVFADHVLMHYASVTKRSTAELISYKANFLSEIADISYDRSTGYNHTKADDLWNTSNVSGFKHRMERLLGFPSFHRRSLADVTYDYYEEKDNDSKSEIRFRIVDRESKPKKTILSGTTKFKSKKKAVVEMKRAIKLGMNVANYDVKQAKNGKWFTVVVDRETTPPDIVAMRKEFFKTSAQAEETKARLAEILSDRFSEEGSFILEHILFRPQQKDSPYLPAPFEAKPGSPQSWDPYSHQVHIIMPGWGSRLSDPPFRAFVEQTIRRELPAHLIPRVCFISQNHMREFEGCYRDWLNAFATPDKKLPLALGKLIACLEMLHTIYPPGTLHDCIEDGDETNPVVLGHTHLGSQPEPKK